MLTDRQFDRTRQLASRLAGLELLPRHRELLDRRTRRLALPSGDELDALLDAADAGEPDAVRRLLPLITIRFTAFFRHPRHFELAVDFALRAFDRRGSARLWSAATATGEEAYSLAMAAIEVFGVDTSPVRILASDIDPVALDMARVGEYGESALRPLGHSRRDRFLAPTDRPHRWSIVPAVRRPIEFRPLNLVAPDWPVDGTFDVIFCRNVLMYLEPAHRGAVLERLAALLAADGALFLDPAEHPGPSEGLFSPVADGVYTLRRPPAAPRRHPDPRNNP